MDKKKNIKIGIFIFLVCIIIGTGFAFQIKMSAGQRLYVSAKSIEDIKIAIEGEKKEVEKLSEILEETKLKVKEYEELENSAYEQKKLVREKLEEELKIYRTASGNDKLTGPGVEVTVDDATRELFAYEDINNLIVHDTDLLMIINELNRCGAEAVSLNGQRITPKTSVICSGYTVRINGEVYARPFKIRAIGDAKRMYEALLAKEGYGEALKQWGVQFEVKIDDEIQMQAIGAMSLNIYMKQVQGEERR